MKTTSSGLTIEQFEQKEASRKLLSENDFKKMIRKDFENFTKKKNNVNRQNNILTSMGIIDSPGHRSLLLDIHNKNNIFLKPPGYLIMVNGNRLSPIEYSNVMKYLITGQSDIMNHRHNKI